MGMTSVGAGAWCGRYRRIPGRTTSFSAVNGGVRIRWVDGWDSDGGEATSSLLSDGVGDLYDQVRWAKTQMGGQAGGSFLMTEHGRVLVPAHDAYEAATPVWCAGTWEGPLEFENPFTNDTFDLTDDNGLSPGDPWRGPYIGLPHTMWPDGSIGIKKTFDRAERGRAAWDWPAGGGDDNLVAALRRVRGRGWARFITGPGGFAITKGRHMRPIYVGRINLASWYAPDE